MTDFQRPDLSEVEALLANRQRLADWLDKLDAAGSKTPPGVRDRVRADYQGRLAQVVDQVRGHSDVINSTLQSLRGQAEEYAALRNEEQETLAEAELRHTVGEYSDDEWSKVEKDCGGKIGGLDEELERLAGEIGRLEEVLRQIAPAKPAAPGG
jgi:septal ring factor EnvC (AmiA/AmiB activator)